MAEASQSPQPTTPPSAAVASCAVVFRDGRTYLPPTVCSGCGYDLTGLGQSGDPSLPLRCPECDAVNPPEVFQLIGPVVCGQCGYPWLLDGSGRPAARCSECGSAVEPVSTQRLAGSPAQAGQSWGVCVRDALDHLITGRLGEWFDQLRIGVREERGATRADVQAILLPAALVGGAGTLLALIIGVGSGAGWQGLGWTIALAMLGWGLTALGALCIATAVICFARVVASHLGLGADVNAPRLVARHVLIFMPVGAVVAIGVLIFSAATGSEAVMLLIPAMFAAIPPLVVFGLYRTRYATVLQRVAPAAPAMLEPPEPLLCESCGRAVHHAEQNDLCAGCKAPIADSSPARRTGTPWQVAGPGRVARWWSTLRAVGFGGARAKACFRRADVGKNAAADLEMFNYLLAFLITLTGIGAVLVLSIADWSAPSVGSVDGSTANESVPPFSVAFGFCVLVGGLGCLAAIGGSFVATGHRLLGRSRIRGDIASVLTAHASLAIPFAVLGAAVVAVVNVPSRTAEVLPWAGWVLAGTAPGVCWYFCLLGAGLSGLRWANPPGAVPAVPPTPAAVRPDAPKSPSA